MTTVPPGDACPACGCAEAQVLCQGSDRLYATTTRTFAVVECRRCQLIRLFPRPAAEELQRYYPANYWFDPAASKADQWAEAYRRLVLRDHLAFVRRALENTGLDLPVMDVGCGGGLLLRELNLPTGKAMGLDFSLQAASVAWATNGVPAVCAELPRAPFPRGSFAVITMFHVLEHLFDPASYLDAVRDLLHPKGRIVLQVPNAGSWQFLLLGQYWNGLDIPRHIFDFRERDLDILLAECGFEVVRKKHFSWRDNPTGMATSLAPSLDPMSRRVRGVPETQARKLGKDLAYFGLTMACVPFAALEALCGAGATIMIEARPSTSR